MNDTDVQSDVKKYELMVIINPEIGESAIRKRLEALRDQIGALSGKISHEEVWGLRDLAYAIKKHDQGFYALFNFEVDPSKIKDLDNTLRLENEVLRHLVMVLPATYEPKDYMAEAAAQAEISESEKTSGKESDEKKPSKTEEIKPLKEKNPKPNTDAKLQSILENPDLNF